MASPSLTAATAFPGRSVTKVSSFTTEFSGLASVRAISSTSPSPPSSSYCWTRRSVAWNASLRIEARELTRKETVTVWDSRKLKKKVRKSSRRLITGRAASGPQYNVPQQQQPETIPLWLWICVSSYGTAKDALQFLWEQPGQLKYIEWPSFQSTIRMAMLTVVVVVFLIIFLATIDSTFSFVLSSILRRVP